MASCWTPARESGPEGQATHYFVSGFTQRGTAGKLSQSHSENTAVRTERFHVAWLIEEPNSFPLVENRSQVL